MSNNQPNNNIPTDPRQYRLQQKQRELERNNVLSNALLEELDDQVTKGLISHDVAREIVKQFEFAYAEQMEVLKNQQSGIEATMEANLDMYRFFDDTADLELSNVKIKYSKPDQTRTKETDKLFIKALDPDQVQ